MLLISDITFQRKNRKKWKKKNKKISEAKKIY